MQALKNANILVMESDLTEDQVFHFQVVDMSFSIHIDNMKKDILVLRRVPAQGLESTLTAEKMYSINFTVKKRNFV